MNKILLIDALNIIFQSYYGSMKMLRSTNSDGDFLLFTFMRKIRAILRLAKLRDVNYACLVFDSTCINVRRKIYPMYKHNRVAAPHSLVDQIDAVKLISAHYGINSLEVDYAEADDSIGFLTSQFQKKFVNGVVYIVSNDNDFLQLMGKQVNIVKKINNRLCVFTYAHYLREWPFPPSEIVDYKSICGDPSDCIPGVRGIGPVIARRLISKFHTVENLYENLEKIERVNTRALFIDTHEHVDKFKKIIKINENLNYIVNFADFQYPSAQQNIDKYNAICDSFNMNTIKINKV